MYTREDDGARVLHGHDGGDEERLVAQLRHQDHRQRRDERVQLFTYEDYNTYRARPWNPFPLRRAHPGSVHTRIIVSDEMDASSCSEAGSYLRLIDFVYHSNGQRRDERVQLFTCEDYNAHPRNPFPLRRAHPGSVHTRIIVSDQMDASSCATAWGLGGKKCAAVPRRARI